MVQHLTSLFFLGAIASAQAVNKKCDYPIDIMFLQDTTASLWDDIPYLKAQLPTVINNIQTMFPNSRTGLAEFRDKPYWPLGSPVDYCYKVDPKGVLTRNPDRTISVTELLNPSGGGDPKEDHYQGAVNVALDPSIGWRPVVGSDDKLSQQIREAIKNGQSKAGEDPLDTPLEAGDEVAARVIVWLTDATPHFAGNMAGAGPDVPQGLPANEGTILGGDLMKACLEREYLDPQLFKRIMKDENNFQLVAMYVPDATNTWPWVNDQLLGQPPKYRQEIDTVSSNLLPAVMTALEEVANICKDLPPLVDPTTDAPEPTEAPTEAPKPTEAPTEAPKPTEAPTEVPKPTEAPTAGPKPTEAPTAGPNPTEGPTVGPKPTEGDHDDCCDGCCDDAAFVLKIREKPVHMDLNVDGKDITAEAP